MSTVPRRLPALLVASVLLASCGRYEPPVGPGLPEPGPTSVAVTDTDLLGTWIPLDEHGAPLRHGRGPAFLALFADGRATGFDGCGTYGPSRWERTGARLAVRGGSIVYVGCPGHEGWFGQVRSLRWDDGVLLAVDEDGRWTRRLRPATAEERREVDARVELASPERSEVLGTWRSPQGADRSRVTFAPDGTSEGYDGCNRFAGGTWRLEGSEVRTVEDGFTTTRGCLGVGIDDRWLSHVEAYRWTDGFLQALAADGSLLGTLQRED